MFAAFVLFFFACKLQVESLRIRPRPAKLHTSSAASVDVPICIHAGATDGNSKISLSNKKAIEDEVWDYTELASLFYVAQNTVAKALPGELDYCFVASFNEKCAPPGGDEKEVEPLESGTPLSKRVHECFGKYVELQMGQMKELVEDLMQTNKKEAAHLMEKFNFDEAVLPKKECVTRTPDDNKEVTCYLAFSYASDTITKIDEEVLKKDIKTVKEEIAKSKLDVGHLKTALKKLITFLKGKFDDFSEDL